MSTIAYSGINNRGIKENAKGAFYPFYNVNQLLITSGQTLDFPFDTIVNPSSDYISHPTANTFTCLIAGLYDISFNVEVILSTDCNISSSSFFICDHATGNPVVGSGISGMHWIKSPYGLTIDGGAATFCVSACSPLTVGQTISARLVFNVATTSGNANFVGNKGPTYSSIMFLGPLFS